MALFLIRHRVNVSDPLLKIPPPWGLSGRDAGGRPPSIRTSSILTTPLPAMAKSRSATLVWIRVVAGVDRPAPLPTIRTFP